MRMCKAAVSTPDAGGTQPLVVAKMYAEMSAHAEKVGVPSEDVMERCASEMLDHVIATQETQAISWTYILHRLSSNPQIQDELRVELQTLHPLVGSSDDRKTLPSPADLDKLPLLEALILETLRLHAANPARMQRIVPPECLTLHGHQIPGGTTVSTNAYCLHRNSEVFPEPFEWKPERWLAAKGDREAEKAAVDEKRRWFWAFGSGPRMCIGQHFAVQGQ